MSFQPEIFYIKSNIIRHKDVPSSIFKELWITLQSGKTWCEEIKNCKKNGEHYWVLANIKPEYNKKNEIVGYVSIRENITDKKTIEQLSITDGLTSLHNGRHFDDIFPKQINISKRNNILLAFIMMDIDHFKQYNDTYGHQAGDDTLIKVASILKNSLHRTDDYTFRLGGEEFGILYRVKNSNEALEIANNLKEKVEALKIEHSGNSASHFITISIGLFILDPTKTYDINNIYKQTDDLLHEAKNGDRNKIIMSC